MNTRIVSKNLRRLRKEHGFTQEDLAKELGISRQAVSKWETGNAIPDLEAFLNLSKLYHISMNDLVEPDIPADIIGDFEQITEIPEAGLKKILSKFTGKDIVKASMGASPAVNDLLVKLFPDIDFGKMQTEIGRVKAAEIEEMHNQMAAMINLEINNKEL